MDRRRQVESCSVNAHDLVNDLQSKLSTLQLNMFDCRRNSFSARETVIHDNFLFSQPGTTSDCHAIVF